jgi:membrane-associated phospholipid phosphatase
LSLISRILEWDALLLEESQALRWHLVTPFFVLVSAWWVKWPLFVAVGGLADVRRRCGMRPQTAICAGSAAAVAAGLAAALQGTFERLRPAFADPASVTSLITTPDQGSFPSGHASVAFAAATAVAAHCPRLRLPLFALAALVAASRVYLGVHFVLDVVAGAALGVTIGLLVAGLGRRLQAVPATR